MKKLQKSYTRKKLYPGKVITKKSYTYYKVMKKLQKSYTPRKL